jgi:hypothetical protein
MSCGLVRGHAYSVTKVIKADIETPRVKGMSLSHLVINIFVEGEPLL